MDDFGEENRKNNIFNWRTQKMKERIVLSMLIMVIAMTGIAAAGGTGNVLLISDSKVPGVEPGTFPHNDDSLVTYLEGLGLTVDTIGMSADFDDDQGGQNPFDNATKLAAITNTDLVIVSRRTNSGNYHDDANPGSYTNLINTMDTPMLLLSSYLTRSSRWDWSTGTNTNNGDRTATTLDIVAGQEGHPFFTGLTGPITIFDWTGTPGTAGECPRDINTAQSAMVSGVIIYGTCGGTGLGEPMLLEFPIGTTLGNGLQTTGPRVFMGSIAYDNNTTGPGGAEHRFIDYVTAGYLTVLENVLNEMIPTLGDPNSNPAPTCSAGPDQSGGYYPEANPVQLAGSASDNGPLNPGADGFPGGIISSAWSLYSAPLGGTATFNPALPANLDYAPEVTFNMPGVYTLELTVYDGNSVPQDANDLVVITVRDHADDFLVGHWAFEDNLLDSTASANHGTGYGLSGDMAAHELAGDRAVLKAVSYSSDTPFVAAGKSLSLVNPVNTEPNQYVSLGDAPELDDQSVPAELTATAWVKTTEAGSACARVIISKGGDGGGGIRWMLKANDGDARIITDNDSNKKTATGGAIDDGFWHFVVGVVKEDAIEIYVDGTLRDDDTGMGPDYDLSGTSQRQGFIGTATSYRWPNPAEPNYPDHVGDEELWIPATEPNQFKVDSPGDGFAYDAKVWNGLLDEIKVYNYALPIDDATYLDIRELAAEAPLPAQVDAGPDRQIELQIPIIATTEGTSEDYGLPGTLIYEWTTISRPAIADSNAVFTNDAALVTDVTFPEFGVWELQLTVFDVDLGIITDTDTVFLILVSPDCSDVIAADLSLICDISGPLGVPDCRCDLWDVAAFAADYKRCNNPQAPGCEDPWAP